MADIVRILDQPPLGLERDFLQDIFFIPESIEEAKEEKPETSKLPKELPLPKPQIFKASLIPSGFLVVLSDKGVNLPVQAFIRTAYDIRRGNPFSNYHPMDFDLTNGTIKTAVTGGSIIDKGENHIRVSVSENKFELRVTGFDEHRDLVIDIREAS